MLGHAGFRNASADYGVRQTGVLPLEFVVQHPPTVVLTPERAKGVDEESRRIDMRLRALDTSRQPTVIGDFPARLFFCGGPTIIPAMERLAAIRQVTT
jgi:iron complex transport system substrate-binding protein